MTWGVCTTVRAAPDQIRAFAAHHLSLGAAHVWLHLDDPEGSAPQHRDITVIRCDSRWWGKHRPDRHQNRQARNMNRLYRDAPLPWIAHLDVDEFIDPARPVAELLAASAADMIRMRPWEALHDPALPDDIFTARQFRAPARHARDLAFGAFADLFPAGALSHHVGKAFFRTGRGLEPRLHGAFREGVRVEGIGFDPDLALLHFHAEDRARWLDRLPFRLERGAYANTPLLRDFLTAQDAAGLALFYNTVQNPSPDRRAALAALGLLREATLHLREKAQSL